jgi:predicted nucleic-acid-binding Zn-ribbon protein
MERAGAGSREGARGERHMTPIEELEHHVQAEHIWPIGWREAKYYLPLDCPNCGRHRLMYALREDGSEGILVHCEKCRAASYSEDELSLPD